MTLSKEHIVRRVMENVGFKPRRKGPQLFLFPELDRTFLNRQTGEMIILRSSRTVRFKASRKLREKINAPDLEA
jgi:hypothetical protein